MASRTGPTTVASSRLATRAVPWLACTWLLAATLPAHAQVTPLTEEQAIEQSGPGSSVIGVDEKLGQMLPLDLAFYDEQGVKRTLRELLGRPTILALVFYHCPGACGMIQGSVAGAVKDAPFQLGKDYQILSISFDDEETPDLALETRTNYVGLIQGPVPENGWRFMTGDAENIRALCTAVGFKAGKLGRHSFMHPNLITVLSGDGKIIRYLYGTEYLPLDVGMAISEASRGTPGLSVRKMMSYCFNYDPASRRYVFRIFRVTGITTLALLGIFLFFLLRKGRTRPPKQPAP